MAWLVFSLVNASPSSSRTALRCPRCRRLGVAADARNFDCQCGYRADLSRDILEYAVVDAAAASQWDAEAIVDPVRSAAAIDGQVAVDPFTKLPRYLAALDVEDRVFLDLGCGYGRTMLPKIRDGHPRVAFGLDVSLEMLRHCRVYADKSGLFPILIRAELSSVPLADGSVDVINSTAVLMHLSRASVAAALAEARRLLSPGGVAYFGDCFFNPIGVMGSQTWLSTQVLRRRERLTWVRQYTRGQIHDLATKAGFHRFEIRPRHYTVLPKNIGRWPSPGRPAIVALNEKISRRLEATRVPGVVTAVFAQNFDLVCWK